MKDFEDRRVGLEQELFLVDEAGNLSGRADEFLGRCRELAASEGVDPESFAPECATSMVEVNTAPARTLEELSSNYLDSLRLALEAGRDLGLRLYPLATYPLPVTPTMREEAHYRAQARTMGPGRFLHAGRCTGTHLHLEMPDGTVDPQLGVGEGLPPAALEELLNVYNLATALDPALVALTRSCPFYQGVADGLAARTAHYRGDRELAPHGLYADLPLLGDLLPYASTAGELARQQFTRYEAWLAAVTRAGVDPGLFPREKGYLLKAAWNPVRLNSHGESGSTVELRSIDSNLPDTVLAVVSLVKRAVDRLRRDGLTVEPSEEVGVLSVDGDRLLVPGFAYLRGHLFREAAARCLDSPQMVSYLDSVVEFAGDGVPAFEGFTTADGGYTNPETELLGELAHLAGPIPEDEGLRLVRRSCEELEERVATLRAGRGTASAETGAL